MSGKKRESIYYPEAIQSNEEVRHDDQVLVSEANVTPENTCLQSNVPARAIPVDQIEWSVNENQNSVDGH